MLDDELAMLAEQVGQGQRTFDPLEGIGLVDSYPRQLAREILAGFGECLLLLEKGLARLEPFLVRNDLTSHAALLKKVSSLSNEPVQPALWLAMLGASANDPWVRLSSVLLPSARNSMRTTVSWPRGLA